MGIYYGDEIFGFRIVKIVNSTNDILEEELDVDEEIFEKELYASKFNKLNYLELDKFKNIIKLLDDKTYRFFVYIDVFTTYDKIGVPFKHWIRVDREQINELTI
jgi:citrate lyase synthetase